MDSENSLGPFKCPLTTCDENTSSSLLLTHFMTSHHHDGGSIGLKEIQENEKVSLLVSVTDEEYLAYDKNICLGILVYKMPRYKQSNGMLADGFKEFTEHVPILIMTSRCNYVKMMDDETDFIDPDADFLAVWLAMPDVASDQKLFATLTIHNDECTKSMSSLVQVRKASDPQDVQDFIDEGSDFLVINSGFLKKVSTSGSIFIEVSITENLSY